MNTEIIAFFSAAGIFRKKKAETQRAAFEAESEAFEAEFGAPLTDDVWQILLDYQAEKQRAAVEREKLRLDKADKKARDIAAMPVAAGLDKATDHIKVMPPGRYVFTTAQNNTLVDESFIKSLLVFCKDKGAELIIGKSLYNKKSFRQPGIDEGENLWFDDAVKPYLMEGHLDFGTAHFIGDANVIPTAKWPTSGFDAATPVGIDCIIPATKIELRMGAALKGSNTKRIVATGSVTKRNYIMRKTGTIASFSHSIGALFIDTINGDFRHLEQMEGTNGFYDLVNFYSPSDIVHSACGVEALQFGDIHAEKMSVSNLQNACSLLDYLTPNHIILHDVLDFSSRNHHNIKDPHFIHAQMVKGESVKGDLQQLAKVMDTLLEASDSEAHVIESNHDLAINTWLKTADPSIDPLNAVTFYKCQLAKYEHTENESGYFNMLEFAYESIGGGTHASNINFHETDESVVIAGVEMGNHGHNGPNGARGNPKGFANLGVAMNTGHTHSPSIYGKCYTAGVAASLEMGYNVGPSSWAIAHVVTYKNGQRQILFA